MLENTENIINTWMTSSDNDYNAMIDMIKTKHYNWSLFLGHLVIEKLLKACFVKIHQQHPPLIHNLIYLAEKTGIELTNDSIDFLSTVTTFNISARYDNYTQEFYRMCTEEYTLKWYDKITEYRIWIKEKYLK